MEVRPYEPQNNRAGCAAACCRSWTRRIFDDVVRTKPQYVRPSIELVVEIDGAIVGIIDVELDTAPNEVASDSGRIGGAIWTIAVHPDHQRKGVGGALLTAAVAEAQLGAEFLEAWTRDDAWVRAWYEQAGFALTQRYLHVYLDAAEVDGVVRTPLQLHVVSAFAHADSGADLPDGLSRIHECVRYVLEVR